MKKSAEAWTPRCVKPSVIFLQSVTIWVQCDLTVFMAVGPLCFIKCNVNLTFYQQILMHFNFRPADKLYGNADPFPAGPTHSAKPLAE